MTIGAWTRALGALALGLSLAGSALAQSGQPRHYSVATGAEGGTYYPVGVALALVAKINLQASHGIDVEGIPSAGSVDNIRLLREGEAQFAILQTMIGRWAHEGTAPFDTVGPQENLRAVTMLWPDAEHFLILTELAETGTVDDLANLTGRGFSIGQLASGTEYTNRFLFGNYGLDFEGWGPAFLTLEETDRALESGGIAGTNISSAVGVAAVTRVMSAMGERLTLLRVTDEQAARFDGGTGLVPVVTIPAATYPGQTEPVQALAQPNFLAVNADVPDDDVYHFTRTMYENLPFLCEIHAAGCALSLDTAIAGLPVPLHPGAERYFREVGLIPAETE